MITFRYLYQAIPCYIAALAVAQTVTLCRVPDGWRISYVGRGR